MDWGLLGVMDWFGQVIVITDGAIHQRYGTIKESIYLIRLDHHIDHHIGYHIGYRSQPVVAERFAVYLESLLHPKRQDVDLPI